MRNFGKDNIIALFCNNLKKIYGFVHDFKLLGAIFHLFVDAEESIEEEKEVAFVVLLRIHVAIAAATPIAEQLAVFAIANCCFRFRVMVSDWSLCNIDSIAIAFSRRE